MMAIIVTSAGVRKRDINRDTLYMNELNEPITFAINLY